MIQKYKIIILLIVVAVLLAVALSFYYFFNVNNKPSVPNIDNVNQQQVQNNPNQGEVKISFREEALNKFYGNPEQSLLLRINNREFRIVSYQSGNPNGRPYNYQDVPKFRGGVTFLEKKNDKWEIFWESSEAIDTCCPSVDLRDLTNDGVEEIIVTVIGPTGENIAYYIYQWRDGIFKIISPVREITTTIGTFKDTEIGGYPAEIKDIDGDNIYEVIVEYEDNISSDPYSPKYVNYRQIYKYNGEQYYLWKEEKVGG